MTGSYHKPRRRRTPPANSGSVSSVSGEVSSVINDGRWSTVLDWLDSIGAGRIPFGYRPPVDGNDQPDGWLNVRRPGGIVKTCRPGDRLFLDASGAVDVEEIS